MISDFIADDDYEKTLKIAGKKHDITGVRVYDIREEKMPNIGLVPMQDAESGEVQWVNTNSASVRLQRYIFKMRFRYSKYTRWWKLCKKIIRLF